MDVVLCEFSFVFLCNEALVSRFLFNLCLVAAGIHGKSATLSLNYFSLLSKKIVGRYRYQYCSFPFYITERTGSEECVYESTDILCNIY